MASDICVLYDRLCAGIEAIGLKRTILTTCVYSDPQGQGVGYSVRFVRLRVKWLAVRFAAHWRLLEGLP